MQQRSQISSNWQERFTRYRALKLRKPQQKKFSARKMQSRQPLKLENPSNAETEAGSTLKAQRRGAHMVEGRHQNLSVHDRKLFCEEEYQTEPNDAELEIREALPAKEKMQKNKEIKLSDFLEVNEPLETGGSFTLKEITEMLDNKELVKSEDDEVTVEEEIISFENAQWAWSTA